MTIEANFGVNGGHPGGVRSRDRQQAILTRFRNQTFPKTTFLATFDGAGDSINMGEFALARSYLGLRSAQPQEGIDDFSRGSRSQRRD